MNVVDLILAGIFAFAVYDGVRHHRGLQPHRLVARANLLDPRFRSVGIGAILTGISGTLYVEVFSAP